jgi:hypothetical protein
MTSDAKRQIVMPLGNLSGSDLWDLGYNTRSMRDNLQRALEGCIPPQPHDYALGGERFVEACAQYEGWAARIQTIIEDLGAIALEVQRQEEEQNARNRGRP